MLIPCLKGRGHTFYSTFIDLIISYIVFLYFINSNHTFVKSIFFITTCFWILISYICGRYSLLPNIRWESYLKGILQGTILSSLITIVFCFSTQYFLSLTLRNFVYVNLLNYFLFKLIILSFISQLIFNYFFRFTYKKDRNFVVIGDIKLLKFLSYEKDKLINLKLIKKENYSKKDNLIVDEIIITKDCLDKDELDFCKNSFLNKTVICGVVQWIEKYLNRTPTELLTDLDFYKLNYTSLHKTFQLRIKRLSDVVFSLILIIISFPICLIIALLIKFEDGGPIFYSQKRNGLKCKPFKILKFRSMQLDAEVNGPQWSKKRDKRITKIGKLIRITRLDEIPQLVSVIKGDMSLIGPRPERPEIDYMLNQHINLYYQRYSIKPGLSGWAQVNYPYGASTEDARNKLSYDFFYIKNYSFFFDIIIFFKTIRLVLNAKGALSKE